MPEPDDRNVHASLVPPTAIRWSTILVFGGAALAAVAGLVLMYVRREA